MIVWSFSISFSLLILQVHVILGNLIHNSTVFVKNRIKNILSFLIFRCLFMTRSTVE